MLLFIILFVMIVISYKMNIDVELYYLCDVLRFCCAGRQVASFRSCWIQSLRFV